MPWFRLRLTLRGPVATPWQSDTFWGHLCWLYLYQRGATAFAAFLDRYQQGDPPVLVSNGFPEGWLPRPLHTHLGTALAPDVPLNEQRAAYNRLRDLKSVDLVREADFLAIQRGETWQPQGDAFTPPRQVQRVTAKNQIGRTSGTTGDGGSLYGLIESWPYRSGDLSPGGNNTPIPVQFYCQVANDFVAEMEQLVTSFAASGYGKRRSVGYGAIRLAELLPFEGFPAPDGANAFVSLSNFVPAANDPMDGVWRSFIKYGKFGEERAVGEDTSPFKRPLIMLEAGAVFRHAPVAAYYGRLVGGISQPYPDAVQYGLALPVPIMWPSTSGLVAGGPP